MEQHTKEPTIQDAPGTELVYLASPYTHECPLVVSDRHWRTMAFVARHLVAGRLVYSPIVYAHTMALRHTMPTSHEWYWIFNKTMIDRCDVVWILRLDGWEQSVGVCAEINYAEMTGKPIKYWPSE
jgi:hypothetical protein